MITLGRSGNNGTTPFQSWRELEDKEADFVMEIL